MRDRLDTMRSLPEDGRLVPAGAEPLFASLVTTPLRASERSAAPTGRLSLDPFWKTAP